MISKMTDNRNYKVSFRHPRHGTISLYRMILDCYKNIYNLKCDLAERLHTPPHRQQWMVQSVILANDSTLSASGVAENDTIEVSILPEQEEPQTKNYKVYFTHPNHGSISVYNMILDTRRRIYDLKCDLAQKFHTPPNRQQWTAQTVILADDTTLSAEEVQENDILQVSVLSTQEQP